MVMAPALIIPFAEAAGITVAGLGMTAITQVVSDFITKQPEKSKEIFESIKDAMIATSPAGIGSIFNKEESDNDTSSTKDIVLGELGKDKGNYSSPDAEGNYSSKRGRIIKALEKSGKIKKGPNKDYDASKKFKDYKKFFNDGGRVNYGLGGLTTQGQRLYDSMSNYGFNEMEIASALDEQQLYPESMTLGLQTEAVAPPRIQPILPINEGGDTQPTPPRSPNYGYAPSKDLSIQDIGEGTITEEEEEFFKEGQRERGMETLKGLGSILGFASNPLFFLAKKGYNMYQDNVQKGIDETNRLEQEKFQRQLVEQQAIKEAARLQQIRDYGNYGESGGSYSGRGDEGATTANFSGDFATDSLSYDLKDGGLATMFVRRR